MQTIPRGYRVALRNAMRADGWPDEGSGGGGPANYCDISAACRAGFPLSAAHLLLGATECPNLSAFLAARPLPLGGDGWPADWPGWSEWFAVNTLECPKCGAFVFTDEGPPGNCGNCLATLPEPPPPAVPFGALPIGARFVFVPESRPGYGGARGPWTKLSARKYVRADGAPMVCRVGTVRALTRLDPDGECQHIPAPRVVPPLGSPLPTCAKCGMVYMPEDEGED